MKKSIEHKIATFNNHIKTNFDWLDFQVTSLDFTKLNIIASYDPSYYLNYNIDLYSTKYLSGNLTWTIDIDKNATAAEIISSKEYTYLPREQENHFFLRFNNTDLESSPFIINIYINSRINDVKLFLHGRLKINIFTPRRR